MEGQQTTLAQAINEAQRLIRMGNLRAAGGITAQLYEQAPDHPPVQAIHGIACSRLGQYKKAAPLLQQAIDAGPEGPMLVRLSNELAQVHLNQGHIAVALAALDHVLAPDPHPLSLLGTTPAALHYAAPPVDALALM